MARRGIVSATFQVFPDGDIDIPTACAECLKLSQKTWEDRKIMFDKLHAAEKILLECEDFSPTCESFPAILDWLKTARLMKARRDVEECERAFFKAVNFDEKSMNACLACQLDRTVKAMTRTGQ